MKKVVSKLGMALGLAAILLSCSSDDDAVANPTADFTLNINGLETLGTGFVYEGWLIVDGAPVSTGTFTSVNFPQTFSVNQSDLQNASNFVLSIEPAGETGQAAATPADTKVLSGSFTNNSASLTVNQQVGDFSNAAGSFFLRTPTDETAGNNGNDENGVWFGVPGMPPTPDFVLPTLPAGWAYEGWVIGDNGPISTGTFTSFDQADDQALFSATAQAGPPVPGEDFFLNAPAGETFPLDVRNRMIVISVEPVPDDSPAPFALKPLTAVAGTETAPASHAFSQNLGSLPTGTVTR